MALKLVEVTGLAHPDGQHLGAYGVGATDAEVILDEVVRAKDNPLKALFQSPPSEFVRRLVVLAAVEHLARCEAIDPS